MMMRDAEEKRRSCLQVRMKNEIMARETALKTASSSWSTTKKGEMLLVVSRYAALIELDATWPTLNNYHVH